ncbi:MAG: hypothetical protein ONA90_07700 [candidate division KSB1 bacterium]|nr:hypothetical protein [candidate division KSB1 bacterium]
MFWKNQDQLTVPTVDQYLRLAHAPPDEALLRRYFAACKGEHIELPLTEVERRWVTVNLEANPIWQQKWQELEEELGKAMDWRLQALFPQAKDKPEFRFHLRGIGGIFELSLPAWAFRLAVAVMIVLAVYGALWVAGKTRLPETHQLASISEYRDELAAGVRGASATSSREFSAGAAALLAAPRNWLGLFPRYDSAHVDSAITHFQCAFAAVNDPFQRAEIAFFLAKAHLMKGDARPAEYWLNQVLAQNVADYREEATTLLQKLARRRK